MIKISYGNLKASFNKFNMIWSSDDLVFKKILNDSIPNEDDLTASSPWKEGPMGTHGIDSIALSNILYLGEKLKVIEYTPDKLPEEKKELIY